jgi:hypothetical protein
MIYGLRRPAGKKNAVAATILTKNQANFVGQAVTFLEHFPSGRTFIGGKA